MSTILDPEPDQQAEGGVWSYVSPSRLALFLKCPLAWKLRYLDGIRTPTSPALFVGKQVHSALELVYRHRMLGLALSTSDAVAHVLAVWDQAVTDEQLSFESTEHEAALKTQTVNLVNAYLAQVSVDEPRPLAVEATMEAPLVDPATGESLGIPLLGVVDLILDAQGGPVIADFKTSSKGSPPFEVTHELQLSSYAWLFRNVAGREEAGLEIRSIIKTKTPKVECHRYPARTDAHFKRLFAVLHEYVDTLDSRRFNFRPGWGCAMCDFRESHCRAWAG